jgi:hypothetical protein
LKIVVERSSTLSTPYHPLRRFNTRLDDLEEYLSSDFDRDRVFGLRLSSVTARLSATLGRRSYFEYNDRKDRGQLNLDLQPAIDVAGLVGQFWKSEVWPARIAFDLFELLAELYVASGMPLAVDAVLGFRFCKLRDRISGSILGLPEKFTAWHSTRSDAFGGLDEQELSEQLTTFQVFHEIGHYSYYREAMKRGGRFSVDEEKNEIDCDDIACHETGIAYGDTLSLGFQESVQISIFLSILVWVLAEHHPALYDGHVRARVLAALDRRAKAATKVVYRMVHPTDKSEGVESKAFRYFPILDEFLSLLEDLFTGMSSNRTDLFEFYGVAEAKEVLYDPPSLRKQDPMTETQPAAWEVVWRTEDAQAEEKYRLREASWEAHKRRPRSRPAYSTELQDHELDG